MKTEMVAANISTVLYDNRKDLNFYSKDLKNESIEMLYTKFHTEMSNLSKANVEMHTVPGNVIISYVGGFMLVPEDDVFEVETK